MSKSATQVVAALRSQRKEFQSEIALLEQEQQQAREDLSRVAGELDSAWTHLASVLVPTLAAQPLDAAAARIRLRDIGQASVAERMRREQAMRSDELAAVVRDPLFRDREAKRNEAAIRLHEIDEAVAPLETSVHELECEPFFREIFDSGYGTDGYRHRFWQSSYYRHWKYADAVLERHGKRLSVEDFAALRRKYVEEKSALAPLRATRDEWRGLVHQVNELEAKHERLSKALETLEARTLTNVRARVREHLSAIHPNERERLLAEDDELRVALARVLGVEAKQRYLDELSRNLIALPLGELRVAAAKAERDIGKLSRPKNSGRTFTDAEFARRFGKDRASGWAKRRARIHEVRTRVVEFHDYDRFRPARDFLWWDVMTDGRLDGDFIDEVRERGPRRHTAADRAAAASASSRDDIALDVS